jgi:ubiquinone/menaquinone biosynthesis C-methylase UbiE
MTLEDVRAVYDGVQAQLYELFMGQQIHIGGLQSSTELADLAGIADGDRGVELCCGSGASMRALVRLRDVASMVGVDAADAPVERGRRSVERDGLSDRIRFMIGDATATDLPGGEADFVWGEDAWCYVVDKAALIAEAVRLTRPGGTIAFTDWVEGPAGLTTDEADQVLEMMTFPSLQDVAWYRSQLEGHGCEILVAEDTGRFGPFFELYSELLRTQLSFDALELLGFSVDLLRVVTEQLAGFGQLGRDGKLGQARFVARRP